MKNLASVAAAFLLAFTLAACKGASPTASKQQSAAEKPAPPAVPDDIETAAENSLGAETDVLAFGDLAGNGRQQILAANLLKVTPQGVAPGILLTRAVILEDEGNTWKEIFRCDAHLENPKGFLGGIPLAEVNGWRLQFDQSKEKGLEMYFTPITRPEGGYLQPMGVRWNPQVKRYESLDRNFEHFLGEVPSLPSLREAER